MAPSAAKGRWLFELTQRLNRDPGDDRAERELRVLLNSTRARERRQGVYAATELTNPSEGVWGRVVEFLDDPDPSIRLSVIDMVGFDAQRASDALLNKCGVAAAKLAVERGHGRGSDEVAAKFEEVFSAEVARRHAEAAGHDV